MFGSDMLEVAIGVIFVYVVLSLACTAFNEIVARMMALRSKTLEDGIRNLQRLSLTENRNSPFGKGYFPEHAPLVLRKG